MRNRRLPDGASRLWMLGALLALPACGGRGTPAAEQRAPIIGGVDDSGDPAVVEVAVNDVGECTGEIISPHVVLTAAHCLVEDVKPTDTFSVFLGANDQNLDPKDKIAAKEVHANPLFDVNQDASAHDIGVVILAQAVAIAPLPVNRMPLDASLVGQPARVVGYGANTDQQQQNDGFGQRRQATASLLRYDADWAYVGTAQANQCFGDSGGPVLMNIGGREVIVGVDSYGLDTGDTCQQANADTRVDQELAFIDQYVNAADPGSPGAGTPDLGGATGEDGGATGAVDGGATPDPGAGAGVGDDAPAAPPSRVAAKAGGGCQAVPGAAGAGSGALLYLLFALGALQRRRGRDAT